MTWYPLQEGFVWGEVSPAYAAQPNSDVRRRGLKTCLNMVPTQEGGVTTRPGMQYISTIVEDYEGEARVIPVDFGVEQRVVLVFVGELSDGTTTPKMHIYTDGVFERKAEFISNPSFVDGFSHWSKISGTNSGSVTWTASGDDGFPETDQYWFRAWQNGEGTGYYTTGCKQTFDIPVHTGDVTFTAVLFGDDGSSTDNCHIIIKAGSTTVYDNEIDNLNGSQPTVIETVIAGFAGYDGSASIQITGTNTTLSGTNQFLVNRLSLTHDEPPLTTIAPIDSPYTSAMLPDLQYVQNPYDQSVWITHKDVPVHIVELSDLGVFTLAPVSWTPGGGTGTKPHWIADPNADDGYPRACGATQGRLVLGGSYAEPQAIWASAPGSAAGWTSIELPNSPTPSTPLWYTLTTQGYMNWILGGGASMLHGTSNGEHVISALSSIIESSDIQAIEQSTNGGAYIQAERVGHEAFYVGGHRREVRSMTFSDELQVHRTDDMTLTARHITKAGVKRIAYARDPFKIVWCVLLDGTMVAMSYDPGSKLLGWHRHETEGHVLDMREGRLFGVDEVYCLVRRDVEGVSHLQLESMLVHGGQLVPCDNYTFDTFTGTKTQIDGLERFEGRDVYVRTRTQLLGPLPVVGGVVQLPEEISQMSIVGIPFHQEIETLPAIPTPAMSGSTGAAKNFSRIGLRLYESSLPKVNGVQYKQHPNKADGKGWGNFASGPVDDYHQHHIGWDFLAPIKVEQDEPLTLRVVGIFGKLTDEDI